jgi:23S rRNA pseudouridine1911/1915/1917 synthase
MPPDPGGIIATYRVSDRQAGQRLDCFLKERIPRLSRESVKEAIRSRVEIAGKRARPALLVRAGDEVHVRELHIEEPPFPVALTPRVIHEDPWLIAVDKPAGLAVHATRSAVKNQLIRWLRERYGETTALAHRIDRETSGIVLSTRSADAARPLARDFAGGAVHKEYLAVVLGVPPERFETDLPVGADPRSAVHIKQAAGVQGGAPSRTRFVRERVSADGSVALVRAFPETGRRHQIRVHLAACGFPVAGDKLYARGERHFLNFRERGLDARMIVTLGASRHLLHAAVLEVRHPATGDRLRLESAPPDDFRAALAAGERP